MSTAIDSHQHFWSISSGKALWPTPAEGPIYRDYSPADLEPHLACTHVGGSVLVQVDPTEENTRYFLELAHAHDFVLGVVGWVDFESPRALERVAEFAADPLLVGLRPMLQIVPDTEWILRPAFGPILESIITHHLSFDALVRPQHLSALLQLCHRHPELRVVIDHAAKPQIQAREFADWARWMQRFASETQASCKISGLVTEAGSADPQVLKPYVDHLLHCFGPQRLLWGSDWPVCEAVCSYATWHSVACELLASLSAAERAAVFGNTAREFYRLQRSARALSALPNG
jgi:L-fuconolactonase